MSRALAGGPFLAAGSAWPGPETWHTNPLIARLFVWLDRLVTWLEGAGRWHRDGSTAAFEPLSMPGRFVFSVADSRLRVRLEPRAGRAGIDVSVQPAVLAYTVRRSSEGARVDPAAADRRVTGAVTALIRDQGTTPLSDAGLLATTGAASFPLLAEPYRRGRQPLDEIPRWAVGAMSQREARSAARMLFGAATTRSVVSALARRLVEPAVTEESPGAADGGAVDLFRVAVAVIAAGVLDPDRLAALIDRAGVIVDPSRWPPADDLGRSARTLAGLPASLVARWLTEVVDHHQPDVVLAEMISLVGGVRHHLPARLPGRLSDLFALCRSLSPIDPRGRGAETLQVRDPVLEAPRHRGRRRHQHFRVDPPAGDRVEAVELFPAEPAGHDRQDPAPWAEARLAPYTGDRTQAVVAAAPHQALPRPRWAPAVDGATLEDGIVLELARTPAELVSWGQMLHNCVADYGPAAAVGQSQLVGVRRHDRLIACCEIVPGGRLRQLLGDRNQPVSTEVADVVIGHLARSGAITAPPVTEAG